MQRVLALLLLATVLFAVPADAAIPWGPAIPSVPPGEFATVTVEGVKHGQRLVSPDFRLVVRASKEFTAVVVKLDGQFVTVSGRAITTENHSDIPQWDFVETLFYEVTLRNLPPGVHHLEIRRGVSGSSLPLINEHDIWFSVGE